MAAERQRGVACLVDSDVAIDFLRRRDYARELLEHWAAEGLLAISAMTRLEIYYGMKPGEQEATDAFLDGLVSIPVDVAVARRAGTLLRGLRSQGVTVGIADAIIASTALELGAPLLTNNVRHYPFPDLTVVRGLRD